jgi:hypothetical protein
MSENNDQSVSDDNGRPIIVGDFIKISSQDPELDDIWCIEYLSAEKMKVLKVDDAGNEKIAEFELEDGIIQDERVEKIELLDFLKEMILKYPNDQELGKQIRKYYFTKDKKSKSK